MPLIFLQCLASLILALDPDYKITPEQLDTAHSIWYNEHVPESKELLAIAFIESRYRQNAVSVKGAKGVFQIMPIAEKDVNETFNKTLTRDRIYDNIAIGALYWKLLKSRYSDLKTAIVAYNAGHVWTDKASIPKETREYWQKFNTMIQAATCEKN